MTFGHDGSNVTADIVTKGMVVADTETPTFSPEELEARYEAERVKRLTEGERHDKSQLNDVLRTHGVTV